MKKMLNAVIGCTMLFAVATLTSCTKEDDTSSVGLTYSLSGNASGSQMVPAVTTNSTGTFTGSYNPSTREMVYTTAWANMSGAPVNGGFYTGAAGTAGAIIGSGWTLGTGLTQNGSISGSTTLNAEQEQALMSGNWYYTMGTAANLTGEMRGQITATRNP